MSELDTLIAAALERKQVALRAQEAEQRERERRQTAVQERALSELLERALSTELRTALGLAIWATPDNAWAKFTYADRSFDIQRGIRDIDTLCLKLPGETGLRYIGKASMVGGKLLDDDLLCALGHWRQRHAVSASAPRAEEEEEEEEQLAEPPF